MSRPTNEVHEAERAHFDRKADSEQRDDDLRIDEGLAKQGRRYLRLIGISPQDLKDRKLLECGCGPGRLSSFLALSGAHVYPFDISSRSVQQTRRRARANGVDDRVHACVALFEGLPYGSDSFDMVQGLFILHHLPDLDAALRELSRVLKPGATASFVETSAANRLLLSCRSLLAGRFGIPKLGTHDEHPLTTDELALIERRFPSRCDIRFPEFQFFGILDRYVFREKIWPLTIILRGLDRLVYLVAPFLRKYSYVVLVRLSKDGVPARVPG